MTDQYLVLGNPVEHSLSPRIHAQFASLTDQEIDYGCRLIELGEFEPAIRQMQREGIVGANVTVPFKKEACEVADELSVHAQIAGAANTLMFKPDGTIYADNTDGVGLVNDIKFNHDCPISDKRILIVGAGGAVRGVLKPLIDESPASITIVNRTLEKADVLREMFKDEYLVRVAGFEQLAGQQFDILINGTSLGLQGKIAPLPSGLFADEALAYDMMYGDGSLPFQQWAKRQGAKIVLDGLGMLVGQAAESFYLWRGKRPDTAAVISALRSAWLHL